MTPTRSWLSPARIIDPRVLTAVAGCILAVQWVHAVFQFGGAGTGDFFGRWTYDAIGFLSGVALLASGLKGRPIRGAWVVLGIGLLSKTLGDVIYSTAGDLATVPVPSISDLFWLAFYPCAYLALLLLVRGRIRTALAATRLDGLIAGVTVASLVACATLPTAFSSSAGAPFWERATDLAYPIGDLVLMGAIVSAVALSGWRVDRTLAVLAAAMVAWVAADLMYMFNANGVAGDIADALVLTGASGMALAATLDRSPHRHRDDRERGLFVAVGFGAVALVILIVGAALHLDLVGLSLSALALALVLIRMALTLAQNRALLGESRVQATTDSLTGLGNRRKLKRDLSDLLTEVNDSRPLALVMLDLNGFKSYNDSFGHAAGDMLLARLGASLATSVQALGEAYRLGGDEFCVIAPCPERDGERISVACADALATRGEGFAITSAHGVVLLPTEARDASSALTLADARMYHNKASAGRPQTASELARVLAAVLEERAPSLADHSKSVCDLAIATGTRLGLSEDELDAMRHAAALHDIGKMAIPDSILDKPGPLSPSEWQLIHQHTIVGERILAAAPSLQRAAQLVRSSHEHFDGQGYPDHLRAEQIPLASRIIAVADAYTAMTSQRPYRPLVSAGEAIAELRRCSGSQFDARVVEAFEHSLRAAQDADAHADVGADAAGQRSAAGV